MHYPGFLGGVGTLRSPNVNAEDTINWIPEIANKGTPKVKLWLTRTPGLRAAYQLNGGPVRAQFEQDGRAFAICGPAFYELFPNDTAILRGIVATNGHPATMCANTEAVPIEGETDGGNQLFIVSGNLGYIYDLVDNTLTQIIDDAFPFPCVMGLFFHGYFVALNGATGAFNLSTILDGMTWNGLDFGLESQVSDRTRAIIRTHDNLWLMSYKHCAPWYNSGDASFPFQPVQGSITDHGIDAIWSAVELDNAPFWVGRDETGKDVVWRANGYTPLRVSNNAIEYYLAQLSRTDDAIAYTYMEEGHLFYVLYLPVAEHTLVYDVTTDLWHKRGLWDPVGMRFEPHLSRNHMFAFGHKHLVGDRRSAVIYEMNLRYLTDQIAVIP